MKSRYCGQFKNAEQITLKGLFDIPDSLNELASRVTEEELAFIRHRNMAGRFFISDAVFVALEGGFLDSFLGELFGQCWVFFQERDLRFRHYVCHAYSMWFEPVKGHRVVPTYEWFIGSRNGALFCVMVDDGR